MQNLKQKTTYGDLVLDTGDVEERLDLLPQFVPGPGPQLEVFPQVPLAHLEGQTLFLQFLELFPGQVTSDPGLHPGDDFAQTFVTQFFHLTQDSGTEEYLLFVWEGESVKPNLVRPVEKLYCGKFSIFSDKPQVRRLNFVVFINNSFTIFETDIKQTSFETEQASTNVRANISFTKYQSITLKMNYMEHLSNGRSSLHKLLQYRPEINANNRF